MATYRPVFRDQYPDCGCVINNICLGNENCAAESTAVQIDRSTLGQSRPSGCAVRRVIGDTSGGLTLIQVCSAAAKWGVKITPHVGSNVAQPKELIAWMREGRSVQANIGTKPLLGTRFRSTAGAINHDVYLNEVRLKAGGSWSDQADVEVLVYDPSANGRERSYHVDQGPSWWPWTLALRCFAALHPWGESDPRTLGAGKVYAAVGPDTEPHVILRYGGKKTSPYPDRMRAENPPGARTRVSIRTRPDRNLAKDIVDTLDPGDLFVAYQKTTGVSKSGSSVWYGNQSGTRWVPGGEMTYEGGST